MRGGAGAGEAVVSCGGRGKTHGRGYLAGANIDDPHSPSSTSVSHSAWPILADIE
jgi:hypothetical protein